MLTKNHQLAVKMKGGDQCSDRGCIRRGEDAGQYPGKNDTEDMYKDKKIK